MGIITIIITGIITIKTQKTLCKQRLFFSLSLAARDIILL